jgi:pimeloyl-ACP methyl ester carboxylesterase
LATAGLTLEDYARDVVELVDEMGVHAPIVAGLSMGGYVALALLRVLGDRMGGIGGLLLADTRPQADSDQGRAGRQRMIGMVDAGGAAAVAAEMLPKLLGDDTRERRPQVAEQVGQLIRAAPPEAIKAAVYRMMARPDSTAQLAQITCPTLIVVGEHDAMTPPALSQDMQARIAGAALTVIPSSGHLANLEQPDAFNEAVHRFLDRV